MASARTLFEKIRGAQLNRGAGAAHRTAALRSNVHAAAAVTATRRRVPHHRPMVRAQDHIVSIERGIEAIAGRAKALRPPPIVQLEESR